MAMTTSYPIYDPFSREMPVAEHLPDTGNFVRRCHRLIKDIYERNVKAGKRGREIFHCIGIHRSRPNFHNYFNLALRIDKFEINPEDVGARQYGGAMGHAEALLSGEWRIANLEEEVECKKRDEQARVDKLAQREKAAGLQAANMFDSIAKRVMGPVTPSLAGVGSVDSTPVKKR